MILIVNDTPAVSVAFRRILDHVGVPSEVVETSREAMAALKRQVWTGFVLDIFLPGDLTGVDILEHLRQREHYAHAPVAVITADILLDETMVARITALDARLYIGVFDRDAIEGICLDLLLAR